ncbi:MAG: FliA/WhiG family RNA polymerase sigma factor [Opitutaceae bacterium]
MDTSSTPENSTPQITPLAYKAYQQTPGASTALVEEHLPLVRQVVGRIKMSLPPHIDSDDLHSVGVMGLIAAAQRYVPQEGRTFAGYAYTKIRGAILDELRRLDWCPRRTRAKARKLKDAIAELEQKHQRGVTDEEVQRHLQLSPQEYEQWLLESSPVTFINIDASAHDASEGFALHETIADENLEPASAGIERAELWRLVADRIETLPDTQKKVLALYHFEGLRLAEIAEAMDLTEARISQIHTQAILALRSFVERNQNK